MTCFAVHFHEKKEDNCFEEVTGRNGKGLYGCSKAALRLLLILFLFFVKVDCKTSDNSSVANDLSTCPGLTSLTITVVGEGESIFKSNLAELLLVSASPSSTYFISEVRGFSAGDSRKTLGTRLIERKRQKNHMRTKESQTSFWLRNLCRESAVIIRLSWGRNPWNRYKGSYNF